jgi:NADH-quinone oxidoreductase subunit C
MADETATVPAPEDGAADEVEEVVETDERREEIFGRFSDLLGDAIEDSLIEPGVDLTIRVRTDAWRAAADAARNHLGAKYFCFLSAIDWLPSPFGRSMDADVDNVLAARAGEAPEPPSAEIVHGTTGGETRFQVFARVARVGGEGEYWGVTLKADVPDEDLTVDSWVPIYAGADWHEREAWEMFGITFTGHPGLRHIYLPGDFEGHPLRKDFPLLSRIVKPWPGIVDVEPMPTDEEEDADGASAGDAEGGEA